MSLQLTLINLLIRWQVKRKFRKNPDVNLLRPLMKQMEPRASKLPQDISVEYLNLGTVPAERLTAPGGRDDAAFLYIHGGGFVAGSPLTHRPLTWRLAKDIGIPVYAIDYRLAPEHCFPVASTIASPPIRPCSTRVFPQNPFSSAAIRRAAT